MSAPEWTTHDLELYHDGELDPDRRERLSADLRRDHRLRARLAQVARTDELTTCALMNERPDTSVRALRVPRRAIAAALGLLVIAAAALLVRHRIVTRPQRPTAPPVGVALTDAPPTPADEPYRAVRVVLSVPVRRAETSADAPREDVPPAAKRRKPPARTPSFDERVASALAVDDVAGAVTLIASNDEPADRDRAYRQLGRRMQSVAGAQAVLDRLPTERQIQVCRQWVEDPHLRRVTFLRLERLQLEPAVADAVRRLILDLAAQPEFGPWLRSHRLVGPPPESAAVPPRAPTPASPSSSRGRL